MEQMLAHSHIKPTVYVARALLTKADWRFLKLVLHAGGYVLRQQAAALRLRPSKEAAYRQFWKLTRLGFLQKADPVSNPNAPQVYKLTARALRCLGRINSHIRRQHAASTVWHKLHTLQFICEQQKQGEVKLAISLKKKLEFFEAHGFSQDLLPPKKGFGEIIGQDDDGIYIYYVDRLGQRARAQFEALFDRYAKAIASGGAHLKFIIVVTHEGRERAYRRVIAARAQPDMPGVGILRIKMLLF